MQALRCGAPIVVALLLLPLAGRAAPDEAERLFEAARRQYTSAEFEEAVKLLTRARTAARREALRAQIEVYLAINYDVLGRLAEARAAFRAALELDPTLELDPRRFKGTTLGLFREVREGLRGRLEVVCEGRRCGAVSLDGTDLGRGPWSLEVAIGARRIEVQSVDGRARFSRRLVIRPGRTARVVASFPPPRGALSVRSTPGGALVLLDGKAIGQTPIVRHGLGVGPHLVTLRREGLVERTIPVEIADGAERQLDIWLPAPTRPRKSEPARRRWTWVAGGAAVVALGVGVGMGIAARATHERWEDTRAAGTDPALFEELRDSGQRKQLAANVLLAVGGVLAATGVVLFVLEGRRPRATVRTLEVSARGGGLELGASF